MIHEFKNKIPVLKSPAFIAQSAELIGDILIGEDVSIWFNTTLRADINKIVIGKKTNIQDNAVIHVTEVNPTFVGEGVTIGHSSIVHACEVGNYCLIGMGAIILDGAKLRDYVLVAANSVVLQNSEIPEGVLVAGVPAKILRALSDEEKKFLEKSADDYVMYAKSYKGKETI